MSWLFPTYGQNISSTQMTARNVFRVMLWFFSALLSVLLWYLTGKNSLCFCSWNNTLTTCLPHASASIMNCRYSFGMARTSRAIAFCGKCSNTCCSLPLNSNVVALSFFEPFIQVCGLSRKFGTNQICLMSSVSLLFSFVGLPHLLILNKFILYILLAFIDQHCMDESDLCFLWYWDKLRWTLADRHHLLAFWKVFYHPCSDRDHKLKRSARHGFNYSFCKALSILGAHDRYGFDHKRPCLFYMNYNGNLTIRPKDSDLGPSADCQYRHFPTDKFFIMLLKNCITSLFSKLLTMVTAWQLLGIICRLLVSILVLYLSINAVPRIILVATLIATPNTALVWCSQILTEQQIMSSPLSTLSPAALRSARTGSTVASQSFGRTFPRTESWATSASK